MPRFKASDRFALAALFLICSIGASHAADCRAMLADFDGAIASRSLADARRLETEIDKDPVCSSEFSRVQKRRVILQVQLATDPAGPLRTTAERESALLDAAAVNAVWSASARLGDLRAGQKRYADAIAQYQKSIGLIARFGDASPAERDGLRKAMAAVSILINDDDEGRRKTQYVAASRDATGKVAGVFSPALRGARPQAVPLPIQFETASTQLTATGQKAFEEMAQAIREQKLQDIGLIGHADQRGADDYNMDLSRRRVEAIARTLSASIAGLSVKVAWRGKREPLDISALPFTPSPTEILALNRRVELVLPASAGN